MPARDYPLDWMGEMRTFSSFTPISYLPIFFEYREITFSFVTSLSAFFKLLIITPYSPGQDINLIGSCYFF